MSASQALTIRLLIRSALADIELEPARVIQAVEDGYMTLQEGNSGCPTKMVIDRSVANRDSIAFSILCFDGRRDLVGYKTSYRHGIDNPDTYDTTISLYDEHGTPYALMVGGTAGAAVHEGLRHLQDYPPNTTMVAIGCDTGEKYLDTVFNDTWLQSHQLHSEPVERQVVGMFEAYRDSHAISCAEVMVA
ncbi:hypothetical protein [Corynebacterium tapiri]|uniref:Cysteine synthase n=1 Tax=Corynebacterium tapiri TaxID=1448266 RepID=A0A5C4U5B9_9CORY|nr:hypothetical protein [Corynebacterium tapiri]TNL98387.1 hypothetical protein FHE74_04055 [Corynebacterium tapiri]